MEELPSIFGDPLLSSAAMDRLLDDAHVIVIDGDSYRNPPLRVHEIGATSHDRRTDRARQDAAAKVPFK